MAAAASSDPYSRPAYIRGDNQPFVYTPSSEITKYSSPVLVTQMCQRYETFFEVIKSVNQFIPDLLELAQSITGSKVLIWSGNTVLEKRENNSTLPKEVKKKIAEHKYVYFDDAKGEFALREDFVNKYKQCEEQIWSLNNGYNESRQDQVLTQNEDCSEVIETMNYFSLTYLKLMRSLRDQVHQKLTNCSEGQENLQKKLVGTVSYFFNNREKSIPRLDLRFSENESMQQLMQVLDTLIESTDNASKKEDLKKYKQGFLESESAKFRNFFDLLSHINDIAKGSLKAQNQLAAEEEKIKEWKEKASKLDQAEAQIQAQAEEINDLKDKLSLANNANQELETKIRENTSTITDLQANIKHVKKEKKALSEELKQRENEANQAEPTSTELTERLAQVSLNPEDSAQEATTTEGEQLATHLEKEDQTVEENKEVENEPTEEAQAASTDETVEVSRSAEAENYTAKAKELLKHTDNLNPSGKKLKATSAELSNKTPIRILKELSGLSGKEAAILTNHFKAMDNKEFSQEEFEKLEKVIQVLKK